MTATDVSVLRLAIDERGGTFVKTELERITKQLATAPAADLLREVGLLLRRVRDEWAFGGAVNEPLRASSEAMQRFAHHVTAARSAAASGELTLVSIIVAAQGELVTVSTANAAEEMRRALEAAAYRTDLEAAEVVWSTVAANEIAERYPELVSIQTSTEGKVFCKHCGGLFAAELVTCPLCGAPAPGRAA